MSILSTIFGGGIMEPVSKIIDELHTSEPEKLEAKTKLLAVQADIVEKAMDYESKLANEQGQTIRAEAAGDSWLQKSWRPITMLMFVSVIAFNYIVVPIAQMFGARQLIVLVLPVDLWELLKIGIGGYVVGRSAEKIVPQVIGALKTKDIA